MKRIRRKLSFARKVALVAACAMIWQMIFPTVSFALTGGPSQPEVNKPSVVSTSKMVDPFTGNLNYSIPLMKVGNYPLSLSYDADVKMDQEASMVGLGWTLNPGVIKRNVRGLPDDFKGEEKITKKFSQKDRLKVGLGAGINLEMFGIDALGLGLNAGLFHDSYSGIGLEYSIAPSISVGGASKGKFSASIGLNVNSQKGASVSPQANMSYSQNVRFARHKLATGGAGGSIGIGATIDSRDGFQSVSLQSSFSTTLGGSTIFNKSSNYTNSFVDQSYSTKIAHPRESFNGSFSGTVGAEAFGAFPGGSMAGYYSLNTLATNKKELPAFGYLYSHAEDRSNRAALDFTREKGGVFEASQSVMGIPAATFDVYNVSGANIGGSFRPYRGDVGVTNDPYSQNLGGNDAQKAVGGISISAEIGAGNLIRGGVNIKTNSSSTVTDAWSSGNELYEPLKNVDPADVSQPDYEPYYFKNSGDKTILTNTDFYDKILNAQPVKADLLKQGSTAMFKTGNTLHGGSSDNSTLNNPLFQDQREQRNNSFHSLTAREAQQVGLERKIKSYELNQSPVLNASVTKINRTGNNGRQPHHMSEISVTRQGGQQYVYGIPAYNTHKEEVAFNISGNSGNCQSGLVKYNRGKDNSTNNERGRTHSFDKTVTPGYAHSYLLTAVLSDDYADLTGNGPSSDDRGDYTKFNYTRVSDNYKWRIPYEENHANYQEGQHSLEDDDGASYVFGKKEIWYIHSIETKNYVAEFTYEDRKDGLGVKGENGGKSTAAGQHQKKLTKITLYSKAERMKAQQNAEPLKTAHFRYDYSLCKGIPNSKNGEGKLTLKEVFFTHGQSEKGRFSPYQFEYSNFNPDYELKAVDRFGNYKANDCSGKQNNFFPYAPQDTADINQWVNAWKLKKIKLPSGGIINIEYEPDDYAYVQDKRAMRMFQVTGFANTANPSSPGDSLYQDSNSNTNGSYQLNNHLFFELETPINSQAALDEYFDGIGQLMFRCKADVVGQEYTGNKPGDTKEFVIGFSEIADYGFYQKSQSGGKYTQAYIQLKPHAIDDVKKPASVDKAQPVAKAAWQHSLINTPRYAYDNTTSQAKAGKQLLSAIKNLGDFVNLFTSFEVQMLKRKLGLKVDNQQSLVRLNDPDKRKYGGGHRVKRITIQDNWAAMTSQQEPGYSYGTEYEYTTTDASGRTISAGVAAYEPKVGGEANALKQPVFFNHKGNEMFMLHPFGESFYPAPTVGYSHVKKTSLERPGVDHPGSGYTIHQFYTAKDFPTQTSRTELENQHEKPDWKQQLNPFKFDYQETRAISQGFLIEKNDMHGKPQAKLVYREGSQTPISGFRYHYQTNADGTLNNQVQVIDKDGNVTEGLRGVTVDFMVDARQQESTVEAKGVDINADAFLAGIIPIVIPIPLPSLKIENTTFRAIATTKVINRQGILKKVESIDHGGKLVEEKLAYDRHSGQPILTKNTNHFGDASYTFNIPSHHAYEGMDAVYQNTGIDIGKQQLQGGVVNLANAGEYFHQGDQLYLEDPDDGQTNPKPLGWVYKTDQNSITIINDIGEHHQDGEYNVKIIRSGYANKHKTNIGQVQTEENPINQGKIDLNNAGPILNANATTYDDHWQTHAGFTVEHKQYDCKCNFVKGNAGLSSIFNNHFSLHDTSYVHTFQSSQFDRSFLSEYYAKKDSITVIKAISQNQWEMVTEPGTSGECHYQISNPNGSSFPAGGIFGNIQPKDRKPYECNDVYGFTVDYTYTPVNSEGEATNDTTITLEGHTTCFKLEECQEQEADPTYTCNLTPGAVVNPYVLGILGNWRQDRTYEYHTERQQSTARNGGTFADFTPFDWSNPGQQEWIWGVANTKVDPFGNALEEKDALDRYNNLLYGYQNNLVIANTKNARYHNTGFDGFEDYGYQNRSANTGECLPPGHFQFDVPTSLTTGGGTSTQSQQKPGWIRSSHSHTGQYSARVTAAQTLEIKRSVGPVGQSVSSDPSKYKIKAEDYAGVFMPSAGKYVISAWVKDPYSLKFDKALSYNAPRIKIEVDGQPAGTVQPEGPIIDGWQRMEGAFSIPENSNTVSISLGLSNGIVAYYDDVRVHPFDAQMESYVYDPYTLRLRATLDPNNFATFYQYDNQGSLVSKKKETERGIMTIEESRFGAFKKK